jgi:hypothetical protein
MLLLELTLENLFLTLDWLDLGLLTDTSFDESALLSLFNSFGAMLSIAILGTADSGSWSMLID